MGKVLKFLNPILAAKSLFDKPKAQAPKPISTTADTQAEAEAKKNKRRRASLFETEGAVSGQELAPEQVQQRPTLLGN